MSRAAAGVVAQRIARAGPGDQRPGARVETARQVVLGDAQRAQAAGERRHVERRLGRQLDAADRWLGIDLGVDGARDPIALVRHRRTSLRVAGARPHERTAVHPDEVAHARARQREQDRPGRERARRHVQAREVAQRAQSPERPLRAEEGPDDDGHVAGPDAAHQVLGLAEHEAACEELRHHRGVRGLARERNAERRPRVGRVLVVVGVRVDLEVELARLAAREHDLRQHGAHLRDQRRRHGGRRGLRDVLRAAPRAAREPTSRPPRSRSTLPRRARRTYDATPVAVASTAQSTPRGSVQNVLMNDVKCRRTRCAW